MIRQVRCECGYLARGRSDNEVIVLILSPCEDRSP